MLQFENVHKSYNEQPVLEIDNLTLERKIYWLQGINGSGKTTFLKILAGQIPFSGMSSSRASAFGKILYPIAVW